MVRSREGRGGGGGGGGGGIEYNSLATYCSDMYLSVGEHEKALEIMAENGWIDR